MDPADALDLAPHAALKASPRLANRHRSHERRERAEPPRQSLPIEGRVVVADEQRAWRFLDVLAFRAYYAARWARGDRAWHARLLARLRRVFPSRPDAPEIVVSSSNAAGVESFIREQQPDLVIARCKTLLKEQIFSIPALGTFVMHPGICPEYRNAHGCFWALANGDAGNVGMTLLRIDRGVDTGPVFGHFRLDADPAAESHVVIQHRAVFDHLDAVRDLLLAIEAGRATAIETEGRPSAVWGQPWLSAHVSMRMRTLGASRKAPAAGRLGTEDS